MANAADHTFLLHGDQIGHEKTAAPVIQQPFDFHLLLKQPVSQTVRLEVVGLGVVHGDEELRRMADGNGKHPTTIVATNPLRSAQKPSIPCCNLRRKPPRIRTGIPRLFGLAGRALVHFGLNGHRRLVHEVGIRPQTVLELAPIKYRIGEGVVVRELGEALDEAQFDGSQRPVAVLGEIVPNPAVSMPSGCSVKP